MTDWFRRSQWRIKLFIIILRLFICFWSSRWLSWCKYQNRETDQVSFFFILTVLSLMSFVNQTRNMTNLNFIARLYFFEFVDEWISKKIKTSSIYFFVFTRPQRSSRRDYTRRQSTKSSKNNVSFYHHKSCIEIRFSNIFRFRHGVVFGSNSRSDITVFSSGINYHHFTLIFDDVDRLIVKNWDSRFEIEIIYDEQKKKKRNDFHWIVDGNDVPMSINRIVINFIDIVRFQIVITHHDMKSSMYMNKINRFKQNIVSAENLFHDLDFSAETERFIEMHTSGTKKIHLKKQFDQKTFDRVTHVWNVKIEKKYAIKKLTVKTFRKGKVDVNVWKNEIHVMNFISHVDMLSDRA